MTFPLRYVTTLLSVASLVVGAALSHAATINYGNFGPDLPTGVTVYQNVRESSGTDEVPPPLYGAPTLTVDTLDFSPDDFSATASGGSSDITDGQLNLEVEVITGIGGEIAGGLESLLVSESGVFTLGGNGSDATSITAGVSAKVTILEVDGNAITPIMVSDDTSSSMDLTTDGPMTLAPWNNALLIEFGPDLAANNIDFEFGVTKAEIVFDDQLLAASEADSTSLVTKTAFSIEPGIVPNPDFVIPEPASAALLVPLGALVPMRRRRVA